MAIYDPKEDESVSDVVRRADKNMYENKFASKAQLKNQGVQMKASQGGA